MRVTCNHRLTLASSLSEHVLKCHMSVELTYVLTSYTWYRAPFQQHLNHQQKHVVILLLTYFV